MILPLHPAGKLGKKLITKVSDIMHKGKSLPLVSPDTVLDKALLEITKKIGHYTSC